MFASTCLTLISPVEHWREILIRIHFCPRAMADHSGACAVGVPRKQVADWNDQTGAIDDVSRAVYTASDSEKAAEGKEITAGLSALKYELQHDRQLT